MAGSLRGWLGQRFARWAQARHAPGARTQLAQRNVYILPAGAGWMLGATLLVLLVAAINYQLNLAYLFTFLLAGAAAASVHATHANLRGLRLEVRDGDAAECFAGRSGALRVQLHSPGRTRWGLRLAVAGQNSVACDVAADQPAEVALPFVAARRGRQPWPTLVLETRYPFGFWRAWSVWRPQLDLWVYPAPEDNAPRVPEMLPQTAADGPLHAPSEELDDLRPYRRGDALRRVLWKKAVGEELVVRAANPGRGSVERWLQWSDLPPGIDPERGLARLCAWVLRAAQDGSNYGLRLPGLEIRPAAGAAQRRACLRALAGEARHD